MWKKSESFFFNPFQNDKFFRPFQTEAFADDNLKFGENGRKCAKWVEKTGAKRRNCSLQAICPFPKVFKAFPKQALVFMCLQYKSFENATVFCPFRELSAIVIKFTIVVCKLFHMENSKICLLGKA